MSIAFLAFTQGLLEYSKLRILILKKRGSSSWAEYKWQNETTQTTTFA